MATLDGSSKELDAQLKARELRQLVRSDFIVLYLVAPRAVYLLGIRHYREMTFRLAPALKPVR